MSERVPQSAPVAAPAQFSSLEEEIRYLRERVAAHEAALGSGEHTPSRERLIKHEIRQYSATPTKEVLKPQFATPEYESTAKALGLKEESHDRQVDELIKIMNEQGIKNALSIATRIGAHLEDDFHKVLVQYLAEGLPARGLPNKSEMFRSLHMSLFEISLPNERKDDQQTNNMQNPLERLLNSMEQFYAGMRAMSEGAKHEHQNVFTVEVAVAQGSEQAVFYVGVPRGKRGLFEKHLFSIYPGARIVELKEDYNIFNEGGHEAAAVAHLEKHPSYPIKLYKHFTHDPLNVIMSAFGKMQKHSEGAALQIVIGGGHGDYYNHHYKQILDEVRKGGYAYKAIKKVGSIWGMVSYEMKKYLFPNQEEHKFVDQVAIDLMTAKVSSRIVPTNIRVVASAKDKLRAQEIVHSITSTFNQFDEAQGNYFRFDDIHGRHLTETIRSFVFRLYSYKELMPLSIAELTTICHLTATGVSTSRELKSSKAKKAPAPVDMPESGIVLGTNRYGGGDTKIHFGERDRLRHFYAIGQTGTGKSTLLKNMFVQDMRNGDGCCYIDPHGSDIVDLLASVPKERYKDVIYFDPAFPDRPMSINMMEYDPKFPEQKTMVVNEILSIFEKLFGKVPESLGPMFQQYFRNAAMLALEGMEPGTMTIADIVRILSNAKFRRACLEKSKNPIVNEFWKEVAEKAGGEASLENVVPYITSKTDIFLANDIMRPILAQPKSSFNFRKMMDEKKIFLGNLSKGRLGDINAEVLGLFIVGKMTQAALSRADTKAGTLPTFYLYIDEFQNFTTPSISVILSEARKYGLSLQVAHQYIKQLDEKIRDAVFGNVGTKMIFRVGVEDAEFLEKTLKPEFSAKDIQGQEMGMGYLSLLVNGVPSKPFDVNCEPPFEADYSVVDMLKKMSYDTYGRDRTEVEDEINARYQPQAPDPKMLDPFARF